MSGHLRTVEQAAERLGLHPKTVLRFIRDGRLQAVKVGRAYRIPAGVLDAFAGVAPAPATAAARVTGIVDIEAVDDEDALRLSALVGAAHLGAWGGGEPLKVDVAHDPARRSLKVVTVGSPGDVAALLKLIDIWLERR